MNTKSILVGGSDPEKADIKAEKMGTSMPLDEIELNEKDKGDSLLQDKKEAEPLESIQNYAQRIKSFLGWESNVLAQELQNEQDEIKNETVETKSSEINSPPLEEIGCAGEEKGNFSGEISSFVGSGEENCKESIDFGQKTGHSNDDLVKINTENLYQNRENKAVQNKGLSENKCCLIPNTESIEMDFENNNVINIPSSGKIDELETNNACCNSNDVSESKAGSLKSDILNVYSGISDSSNFLVPQENKKLLEIQISDKNRSSEDGINERGINNNSSSDSSSYDFKHDNEKINPNFPKHTNIFSEKEPMNPTFVKEEFNSPSISDKGYVGESVNPDELSYSYTDDSKSTKNESNSRSFNKNDSFANVDFVKEENQNESSEFMFGKVSDSVLERECPEENENDDVDTQSAKIEFAEGFTNVEQIEKNVKSDTDDLISDDSLDISGNFAFEKSIPKEYVKEIRRLSKEIVKEVIESARNSVYELCAGKSETSNDILPSETLTIPDHAVNSLESFIHKEKFSKNIPESNKNILNENFVKNSNLSKDHIVNGKDVHDENTICGFSYFHPKWIQKYATPRAFLVLFSIIGIIHGCYYSYVVSILSTLEKRYAFKTKISGVILLADEITPLVLGIVVGYIGGKTHRPRMVAIGMFMSAACCFISGLPYLIYGVSKHSSYLHTPHKTGIKFCEIGLNNTDCNSDDQPPTLSVIGIFLLASFLKGFATLSYYVIGFSYMDDIIKRKNSPFYFAIALALRLLGPLVGYLMSSGFLKYYENPLYDPGFGPDDPRWIGAWWMGFFLQGILLVIFTIPIALFPRRLPSQKKVERVDVGASEEGFKEILTGLLSALKRLGKNPVFIVLIINTNMKVFGHFGHSIMLPKYMENRFRLSASEASLYSGATSIVCIILSTLLGGFLIWKYTPRIKILLGGMIASETILCFGYLMLMIPRCQTSEMLNFGINGEGLVLNSVCNNGCDCSTSSFTPFCGPDGKTLYFSPCYAGCTEEVTPLTASKSDKQFSNCSCVDQQELGTTVTEGFCPDETCRRQAIFYLVILFFLVTISNLFTVAATMILLRSVHPSDKSVALGTFETFICLFGFIPFPVTFGALVDSACLVWEKSCGETGNCWFYDMDKYGYLLHGASALFCALSVICLIILYFLSPRVRNLYIEEDEEEHQTKYADIKLDTVSGSVTKL